MMNGFDNYRHVAGHKRVVDECDLSRLSIDAHVARAHALRAACMRTWFQRHWQSWASVFRGTGRAIPPGAHLKASAR